jgi:hypothetical protein
VSGGNDADVHFDGAAPAEALDFAILQYAQQFYLDSRAEFADFIKEYGPAICSLKSPGPTG